MSLKVVREDGLLVRPVYFSVPGIKQNISLMKHSSHFDLFTSGGDKPLEGYRASRENTMEAEIPR